MRIQDTINQLAWEQNEDEEKRIALYIKLKSQIAKIEPRDIETYEGCRDYYRAKKILHSIKRSKKKRINRFILATLMKSGTKHLERCLSEVYKLERYTPPFDFENIKQSPSRIKPVFLNETEFMYGESFASYHLYPGRDLIALAKYYKIPSIVLLRNPAQTIVSHYYYCKKNSFGPRQTQGPGEYYGTYIEKDGKFDLKTFLLRNTFPRAVTFIDSWLSLRKKAVKIGLEVKILFQEDLVNNSDRFYEDLDSVLSIDSERKITSSDFKEITNHNKRKGSTSEWLEFFNEREREYLREKVGMLMSKHRELSAVWEL